MLMISTPYLDKPILFSRRFPAWKTIYKGWIGIAFGSTIGRFLPFYDNIYCLL
jgi:hypothetical protein